MTGALPFIKDTKSVRKVLVQPTISGFLSRTDLFPWEAGMPNRACYLFLSAP